MLTEALRAMTSVIAVAILLQPCRSVVASEEIHDALEPDHELMVVNHVADPTSKSFNTLCRQPVRGWEMSVESLYLKPDFGEGNLFDSRVGDFEQSSRISLGYQLNERWSLRSTLWGDTFSGLRNDGRTEISGTPPAGGSFGQTSGEELEFLSMDGQLRRQFLIRDTVRADGYVGLHYAELGYETLLGFSSVDFDNDQAAGSFGEFDFNVQSVGFTFGTDLWLPLKQFPHLAIVGNLQGSVLGGSVSTRLSREFVQAGVAAGDLTLDSLESNNTLGSEDVAMWVGRAQVGAQYNTVWADRVFFARGVFEFQSWGTSEFDLNVGINSVQLSLDPMLYGVGFSVGMER